MRAMKRLTPVLLCSFLALALPGPTAAQDDVSLDQQGMEAYQRKDFARSADLFAQAVADAREDDPSRLYNAACTGALAGRIDAPSGSCGAQSKLATMMPRSWRRTPTWRRCTPIRAGPGCSPDCRRCRRANACNGKAPRWPRPGART